MSPLYLLYFMLIVKLNTIFVFLYLLKHFINRYCNGFNISKLVITIKYIHRILSQTWIYGQTLL